MDEVVPRVISFDGDGTLWNLEATMESALNDAAQRFQSAGISVDGSPVSGAWLREVREKVAARIEFSQSSMEEIRFAAFKEAALRCGEESDTFVISAYDAYMAARFDKLQFFPESIVVLTELKELGYKLVLITNGNTRPERVGLANYFDGSVVAFDCGHRKPSPLIYRHAVNLMAIDATEWLHIGDDYLEDVEAAREAGMRSVWLQRNGTTGDIEACEQVIGDLTEVRSILSLYQ